MKPNLDLLFEFEVFAVGDDDGDLVGGARFVYVATEARNNANNSGKRFFNSCKYKDRFKNHTLRKEEKI